MRFKAILVALILVPALSLAACGSSDEGGTGETTDSSGDDATASSAKNYGCSVFETTPDITDEMSLAVDQGATVILCSNQTTGFQWSEQAEIADTSVLTQTRHESVAPTSDALGAPGEEKYSFKGLKKGQTTVHLEYSQPWDGGEKAIWTCALTVVVG